jgi:hypothetical protein
MLSGPADPMLEQLLPDEETYDAAWYAATVVPSGDTLHVRYVFASEEYPADGPRAGGALQRDVMGVFVDGVNCATVPFTAEPVSATTINGEDHAEYYVDNADGARPIAMDGLTTVLPCDVPVTPGRPVTVHVAVADWDAYDDSVVALRDNGIWSD